MKVTDHTRRSLAFRRQERELTAQGYRRHETDWEIHRGGRYSDVIVDVKLSICGKYVYTKLGPPTSRVVDTMSVDSEALECLKAAGDVLSNCAFNLAQKAGETLTQRDAEALGKCRREWDDAREGLRAALSAPTTETWPKC